MDTETFGFGEALGKIKSGVRVARKGWLNLSCIFLVRGSTFKVGRAPLDRFFPTGTEVQYRAHIDGIGADGLIGVWSPSIVDLLAEDWVVVPDVA